MLITINGHSEKSLRNAAKKVRAYQRKVITNNRELLKDLAVAGLDVASIRLNVIASNYERPNFSTLDPHVYNGDRKGAMSVTLRLQGKQAVFVEFGAGVYYNGNPHGSPHPWGVELGYTIGDYGNHGGLKKAWGIAADGSLIRGTPAAMPLFYASKAIEANARDLAMVHFGS